MKFAIILTLLVFSFFYCSDSNKNPSSSNTTTANESRSREEISPNRNWNVTPTSSEFNGISTNPDIIIQNGILSVNLKSGMLTTSSSQTAQLVVNNQINGTLSLKDIISGGSINGVTVVTMDKITFTPDKPLHSNMVYQFVFLENSTNIQHKENIFISVANLCNPESYFSKVPVQKSVPGSNEVRNIEIQNAISKDSSSEPIAIIAWDHSTSKSFYFKILNRSTGAKYKIVSSLGVYNIPGHECELYHQRDSNSPFPTWTDYNYGSKVTKVTSEDTMIHHPITKEFYSFSKTYLLIKVFNQSNVDITSADNATLSLEQTDSLYGLPLAFNSDEDSSLLAYLNRGNNNSYSMVLGGLIVGIFAFFLSRRIFKRDDEV